MPAADTAAPALEESTQRTLTELVVRGMRRGDSSPEMATLTARGFAVTKGPMSMPTPKGIEVIRHVLRLPEGSDAERQVRALYEAFLPINHRIRDVCTAWQCLPDGRPNDHSDETYDAGVRDDLDDVDDAIAPILRRLAKVLPRTAEYRKRLTEALDRLDAGDRAWLTSPLLDSYHTVWMHLHQELLLALGVSRAEDEELEKRLVKGRAAG